MYHHIHFYANIGNSHEHLTWRNRKGVSTENLWMLRRHLKKQTFYRYTSDYSANSSLQRSSSDIFRVSYCQFFSLFAMYCQSFCKVPCCLISRVEKILSIVIKDVVSHTEGGNQRILLEQNKLCNT